MQRCVLLLASCAACAAAAALVPHRWRGNQYVLDPSLQRDDGRYAGVLPWQRCNATGQFHPGASRLFATFVHEGATYDISATALSMWGAADASGAPDRAAAPLLAELLVFFGLEGRPCRVAHFNHCVVALTRPRVRCRPVGSEPWAEGATVLTTKFPPPFEGPVQHIESTFAATMTCPLDSTFVLTDAFELEFVIGDNLEDPRARLVVDACYEHVDAADDLVVCTEPHYGFNATGKFWNAVPPYPHGLNLLDAFLVYHTRVMGARVVFTDHLFEAGAYITQHYGTQRGVEYRSGWVLSDLPSFHNVERNVGLDIETFAESTCIWEQRIRSRWIVILHSVDNFLFPLRFGERFGDLLARVDMRVYSELKVPYQQLFSPPNVTRAWSSARNILQRYSLIGPSVPDLDFRETPIGNPRHTTFSGVHWLGYGARPEYKHAMPSQEVYDLLGLTTHHILCLARPSMDEHVGERSPAWDFVGDALAAALLQQHHRSGNDATGEVQLLMLRHSTLGTSRAQIDIVIASMAVIGLVLRLRRSAAAKAQIAAVEPVV